MSDLADVDRSRRLRYAVLLTCGVAAAWAAAYIAWRAAQPFPLDAFEEYQLYKAVRWSDGDALYGSPETETTPEAYPPLYFWLLGSWTRWFGISFLAQRSISLAALAVVVGCGWWSLRDASDRWIARAVFLAVLLSLHEFSGKFFEVGKPDALLACLLSIAFVTGEHRNRMQLVVSSAALWLASLTKQNAFCFVLPIVVALVWAGRWRRAVAWGAGMLLLVASTYVVLDVMADGHFRYWVVHWTAGHGIDFGRGSIRAAAAVVWQAPIVLVVLVLCLAHGRREAWWLLASLIVGVIGMSKAGGESNHLLPLGVFAAIAAGRWMDRVWAGIARFAGAGDWGASSRGATPIGWVAGVALGVSMLATWAMGLPTRRDFQWVTKRAAETRDWIAAVRALPGSVAVSHHYLLARSAGAECFFSDLILEFPGLVVPEPVRRRIGSEQFEYLVLDSDPKRVDTVGWGELVDRHYVFVGDLQFRNRSNLLPRRVFHARREVGDLSAPAPSVRRQQSVEEYKFDSHEREKPRRRGLSFTGGA